MKLLVKFGQQHEARIFRGVEQVAAMWRAEDGDFAEFCLAQFVAEPKALDALFDRLQATIEQINGHFLELGRTVRWATEVDIGPMLPVDQLLAGYDASSHFADDMYKSKVAFSVLLNFPLTKLEDRIKNAASYSRRQWAELRLTSMFESRIPGDIAGGVTAAEVAADQYISGYYLYMHHVLGRDGVRRFPKDKRLITHWNLRDELKANYADAEGLAKQQTIAKVMERIVTQTIPPQVINNPRVDWDPFTNKVTDAADGTIEKSDSVARDNDERFERVIAHFNAARAVDKVSPIAPSRMDRAFTAAELPEARVRAMLVEILESPHGQAAAKEVAAKLGRPLEPHDMWFNFAAGSTAEGELDAITKKRYPTAAKFEADMPRILRDLGFTPARAKYLAARITVDPSRGAGHAMEAGRRTDKAHLRTRIEPGGMLYKGYNIAIHELGHNVEQTFSLYDVDHTLLQGVPNTAFTEALAFLFQARALELLGRPRPKGDAERNKVLADFWNTREIAGSALVEIDVWHWLYAHPSATAAELRDATGRIARETWDRYYAPILGGKGTTSLLGIYSHTITSPLYVFNYVVGHVIAFQVEEHLAGKDQATFAKEFERVCRIGNVLPDLWMQQATGKPVTPKPLLDATARALKP
ncbi:MAG: hypothetical protein H0T46_04175 [Deltaproteobacteria bacterium]|nr:hypothetical protein [Deltaproteobacteria bacterium]